MPEPTKLITVQNVNRRGFAGDASQWAAPGRGAKGNGKSGGGKGRGKTFIGSGGNRKSKPKPKPRDETTWISDNLRFFMFRLLCTDNSRTDGNSITFFRVTFHASFP
jgi:hypothetical protein